MNTPADLIKQFGSLMSKLEDQSKRIDKSWWSLADAVGQIGASVEKGWPGALAKTVGIQQQMISGFKRLTEVMRDPGVYAEMLKKKRESFHEMLRLQNKIASGTATADEIKLLPILHKKHSLLTSEVAKYEALHKMRGYDMIYLPVLVGSLAKAAHWSEAMQKSLINANGSIKERYHIEQAIAGVQRSTGANAETLASATAAAVKHGLELRSTYQSDLDLIVKMQEGMGVSAESSAELVASMRLMNQNAKGVADAIARIKADTGLAADEATRLAKQITIAMSVMAPGGNVSKVVETVGRLEGAASQLGLQTGKITSMMEGFTKSSGLTGVGMLGLQPDFLKDETTAMKAFAEMVRQTEGPLKAAGSGWQRMATLEMYAEVFGTTTDIIANGRKILDEYNKTAKKSTTLQDEWQKQTSSFAKSWDKLKNQLWGMTQTVLLPLVKVLQRVIDMLTWVTTKISESTTATVLMATALTGGLLHTFVRMGPFIKGLLPFVTKIGSAVPFLTKLGPMFGSVHTFLAGLAGSGSALTMLIRLLGGPGVYLALGWQIGRLIGANTKLDETIQKAFLRGVYGVKEAKKDPLLDSGRMMTGTEWKRRVMSLRARGTQEEDIYKWAFDNIKNIKEFQTMDISRAPAAVRGLQDWYTEEGHKRQRITEYQATTFNANRVVELTSKNSEYLERIAKASDIMAEAAKQTRGDVRQDKADKAAKEEREATDRAFGRFTLPQSTLRRTTQ